jgi:hypothetical protein
VKKRIKAGLTLLPFTLLGWGVYASVIDVHGKMVREDQIHRYGKSDFVPAWMPKSWVAKFLRATHLDIDESLFQRSLEEMANSVEASEWVKEVKKVERNFKGEFSLALDVRKPVCVMTNQGANWYYDTDLIQLPVLSTQNIHQLADGDILPIVHVDPIAKDTSQNRMKWCGEIVNLAVAWNEDPVISDRLRLLEIELEPYRTTNFNECRLILKVRDNKFSQMITINWGINRDYNELEDRTSQDKWTDLIFAIGQERPFQALDLRYKKPEITTGGKGGLLRR